MIKVFVIGTGNLGTQLCLALEAVDKNLVSLLGYTNYSNKSVQLIKAPLHLTIPKNCDLIILAVPDDRIASISDLIETNAIVVHTSGSVPMSALQAHDNRGVFYIPQTFSKTRTVDFSKVTLCLEWSNIHTMSVLNTLGSTLSRKQRQINSTQRNQLHLAAVYMNNFANHCFYKSQQLLKESGLDADLLDPLMKETTAKAQSIGPENAQTGPARRGDDQTIERHVQQLPVEDRDLYLIMSESIKKTYEN